MTLNVGKSSVEDDLAEGRFVPDLMLPAWFVANSRLDIKDLNDPMATLLSHLGESAEPSTWNATWDNLPDGQPNALSIWRRIVSDAADAEEDRELVRNILDALEIQRRLISSFRGGAGDLNDLLNSKNINWEAADGSYRVYAIGVDPADVGDQQSFLLRAGVRSHRAHGIRTKFMHSDAIHSDERHQICREFARIQLTIAQRFVVHRQVNGSLECAYHGIQPALHPFEVLFEGMEGHREDVWLKLAGAIYHGLTPGLRKMISGLLFSSALYQEVAKDQDLSKRLLTVVRENKLVSNAARKLLRHELSSDRLVDELIREHEAGIAMCEAQARFCNVMRRVGRRFELAQPDEYREPAQPPRSYFTEYSFRQLVEDLINRAYVSRDEEQEILRPKPKIILDMNTGFEVLDQDYACHDCFEFVLNELIVNMLKYSPTDEDLHISVARKPNKIEFSIRNRVGTRQPSQSEACSGKNCKAWDRPTTVPFYEDSDGTFCVYCFEQKLRNRFKDCYQYGKSTGATGGRGLYLMKYIVTELFARRSDLTGIHRGEVFDEEEILESFSSDGRIKMGFRVPYDRGCGFGVRRIGG